MASILANTVADVDSQEGTAIDFTATGFRDSTRIAAGPPELWTGIFLQNKDVILALIDNIVDNLHEFKDMLQKNDEIEIERLLDAAQETVMKHSENRI